jgi:endonuclease G
MKHFFSKITLGLSLAFILGETVSFAQPAPPPTPQPVAAATPAPPKARKKKPYVDIVKLKHEYFTSYYSKSQRIPIVVTYKLTNSMLWCDPHVGRTNKFVPDPLLTSYTNNLKDYVRSGYDKGHNMSAEDNVCSYDGMDECYYFSNMTPQPHFFNAGIWAELEKAEREEVRKHGTIMVSVGCTGKKATIGAHKVVVPKYMWKVVYIPSDDLYFCYMFPNSDEVADGNYNDYRVNLSYIKTNAGVHFENGIAVPNK